MTGDFLLSKVTLYNYYLYKGEVTIDFNNADPNRNLYLFIFKNGGGKTSLFHGIKWGFYGDKFEYYKENKKMTAKDMVNTYAAKDGEGFYVEIEFYYNGGEYKLRRTCDIPKNGVNKLALTTPDDTLFENDAKEMLDTIVPKDYGQFFMFDGRDLSSLSYAQNDKERVDSVLKLLGLSSIQEAKKKIELVKNNLNQQLVSSKSSNSKLERAKEEYATYLQQETGITSEIENAKSQLEKIRADILNYTRMIDESKEIQLLIAQKNELENNRIAAESDKTNALEVLSNNRKSIHVALLKNEIDSLIALDENNLENLSHTTGLDANEIKGLELMKMILENSLCSCPACSHSISVDDYNILKLKLAENEDRLKIQANNIEKMNECRDDLNFFRNLSNRDFNEAYRWLVKYYSAIDRISKYESDLNDISKQIEKSGIDRVETWQKNLNDCKKKEMDIQYNLGILTDKKARATKNKDKAFTETKISITGDEKLQDLTKRIGFCESLIAKITSVIDQSVCRMRGKILEVSNNFFLDMTNKADVYDHLEYVNDKSYQMHIVKKDGDIVSAGSTGEVQIIAMSFLLALSQCSGKSTPIVMDTPTTNLDDVHSQGIERSLKSIPNQVLYLAQPAESTEQFIESVKPITAKIFFTKHDEHDNGIIVEVDL